MTEDFYDLLDVSPDASQQEIKQAFRTQVRIYHPDLNDDDRARAQFTVLKKAYDILGDPVERQAYDRLGHHDYVAKRTSGLPSADLWQTADDDGDDSGSTSEKSTTKRRTTTTGSRTATTGSGSHSRSRSKRSSTSQTTGSTSRTTGSTSRSSTSSATAERSTDRSRRTQTTETTRTDERRGGTTSSSSTASRTQSSRLTDNAFVEWWHSKNFAWPLIWLSALTYLAGLVHFALENAAALRGLGAELAAVGTDPAAAWAVLTESRHGVDVPAAFVSTVELVSPPLGPAQWYGVLAGVVVASLALVVAARVAWRRDTWGPITFDETIVVGLALGVTTLFVGGPLLAGAALMPLLFGVIVYRTRQLPGWSPSYLYVFAVCVPAVALAAGAAGYASLPTDAVAFALLPLSGAFGLPLRVGIRKRFGR